MQRKITLLTSFIASSIMLRGQIDKKIDSLQTLISKQVEDSNKVNSLTALSKRFLQLNDISNAKLHATDALHLSRKLGFKKGEAAIQQHFGMINTREYKFPDAMKSFQSFLKLTEELGDRKGMSNAYVAIANTYFQQGDYSEAIRSHLVAAKIKTELNDKPGMILCYNNIGLNYWNMGKYPEAYSHYRQALKLRQEIKDSLGIAHSYNVLGVVYDDEGNYTESLKNYFLSLNIYEKLRADFGIAACNNNIGELYRKQNNYSEALKRFAMALAVYEKMGNKGGIAMCYSNRSEILILQDQREQALKELNLALEICEEQDDKYGIAAACGNLGILHYKEALASTDLVKKKEFLNQALPYAMRALKNFETISQKDGIAGCYNSIGLIHTELGNYKEGEKYLKDGLDLSKETGVKERIKESYEAIARLDSITGKWESAYKNRNAYINYRDSLLNKENTEKLTRLQVQYEFSKKEDSLRLQQALVDEKLIQQTLLANQQRQALILNENELVLLNNHKRIQQLELDKHKSDLAIRSIEAEKDKARYDVLNKEKVLQAYELNKQKIAKGYIIAGFGLFAILSFFIYRNYRNRQQLKLQVMRNKIASDLHDDIGSTLSSISIFSQMAQQQSKETIPLLETIGENSRKMLDAMADIVWTINPQNDQFEKIILRMKSFAYELLGAKKIDFEFVADQDISKLKLSMDIRKNLYLIFKEATNNMVKYSGAQKAHFSIKNEKNNLVMQIVDDGTGFDTAMSTKGNGLKNMRKRAEEMGAVFQLDSGKDRGTKIEVRLVV
jgi:signal transduction histidine kinase